MKHYSLSDYRLSITFNNVTLRNAFGTITIGGQGSTTDSISVEPNGTLYSTASYATGGYVHEKNLDKTGKAKVSLNQMSEACYVLNNVVKMYYQANYEGATISVVDADGRTVATCKDCVPTSQPARTFGQSSGMLDWEWTCGVIDF